MSESKRKPLLLRVSDALRVLSSGEEQSRTIVPTTYPNYPAGIQQMQLVRTADPTEYRRDGRTIRVQGFNAHPVVHACIRVIADIVASVPLVVLKEKGNYETRVGDDNPLQKLLNYPGPRFTARQFRARFAVDFLGYGNAFFVMERPGENRPPVGLRAVNPESLQQVWIDTEGDPRRYDYANWAGLIVNVLTEDMLHFRDLEMGRPFEADVFGYPRGATAIGSLLADNEATQYVRQVVTNDGTPTFAVIMSDEATSEDAAAMQDRYRARVVDRGKRGTPAFFGAVKDIKPLGFTLSDLEFPDLRRVSREDICAAFGVDPRMIGIASASSDAGLSGIQYTEARARLVQHTIEPLFAAFEDELNHWLAPEFGDVWVTYDHDVLRDLVENDTETSTRIRAEYSEGLRTWEESRRAIKLSPLPEPTDSLLKVAGRDLVPAAIAVIDPRDVMTEAPATDNEQVPVPTDSTAVAQPQGADIQAQALNGAQVTSLVEMLNLLASNQLPASTVEALIKAAFPLVPDALIQQMLGGMSGFAPAVPEVPAPRRDVAMLVRTFAEDALNGDQIEGLIELLEALVEKELPMETVKAALLAAFPKIDAELIDKMLAGLEGFEMPEEEPEMPESEDEEEDEGEEPEMSRATDVTNFPSEGDDKKVTLRNSQWKLFPVGEAEDLKENWPEIWRKGGNIKGNEQFAKLAPIAKRGGVPDGEAEENAIRLREAWVARHEGDHQLAGVVAQIKWLAVGSRGLDHMRKVINEAKDKAKERTAEPVQTRSGPKYEYWQRAMQELDRMEQSYKSAASAQFARERKRVVDMIRSSGSTSVASAKVKAAYREDGEFADDWRTSFEPMIDKSYQAGAKQVMGAEASIPAVLADETVRQDPFEELVGVLSAKELKAAALKAIANRSQLLSARVSDTTAKEVLAAIRAGEMASMSVDEIARLVGRAVYGEARVDARSTMIARTEAAGAMSQGSWDQAEQEGDLFKTKTWLSFSDDRTRETHLELNDTTMPMDDPFITAAGNVLMYPLDPGADASEVINCRCVLAFSDQ